MCQQGCALVASEINSDKRRRELAILSLALRAGRWRRTRRRRGTAHIDLRGAHRFACIRTGAAALGGFASRFRSQDHFLRARPLVIFAEKEGVAQSAPRRNSHRRDGRAPGNRKAALGRYERARRAARGGLSCRAARQRARSRLRLAREAYTWPASETALRPARQHTPGSRRSPFRAAARCMGRLRPARHHNSCSRRRDAACRSSA